MVQPDLNGILRANMLSWPLTNFLPISVVA